jgi:hypothetical protein
MSANLYVIEDYENDTAFRLQKNKPNSNPISINRGIINCIYEVGLIYCRK